MTSPVVSATRTDRAGSPPSTAATTDSPDFGPLFDSQLAASSIPFSPHTVASPQTAAPGATATEPAASRIERGSARHGNRRQRK